MEGLRRTQLRIQLPTYIIVGTAVTIESRPKVQDIVPQPKFESIKPPHIGPIKVPAANAQL